MDKDAIRIEYMPLDKLQRWPRNPKAHDLGALHVSINRFGFVAPITIDERTGKIVAGHGRLDALQQMKAGGKDAPAGIEVRDGEWYAPVVRGIRFNSDAELEAYLVADNHLVELGGWEEEELAALLSDLAAEDEELLEATGYDADDLDALLAEVGQGAESPDDPGAQVDRAAELLEVWGVECGDVWEIPSKRAPGKVHRVMCGDSTRAEDMATLMGGERAEMVWTDPPYGVAMGDKNKMLNTIAPGNRIEENMENDTLTEPELVAMLERAFDCAILHCAAGAAWYIAAPPGPLHVLFGLVLKARGIWRQTIQWVKNNATFVPLGVDYRWRAEPIFYGWLPNAGHRYYGGRQQDTVWNIDRPSASPEHPTMKPPELVARAINNSSRTGEGALDLFLGSGTTIVACEQTGRIGYGMEIEPKYVAVTLQRLADMGLEPRRVETSALMEEPV